MKNLTQFMVGWCLLVLGWMSPTRAESFNLPPLDAYVSPDSPEVGAGRIETLGEMDEYLFLVGSPVVIYLSEDSGEGTLEWYLEDPDGNVLFQNPLEGYDPGRIELSTTGIYRLVVRAATWAPETIGNYSFSVTQVSESQYFAIGLDELISENSPFFGAGVLETAGTSDGYYFTGSAGQILIFDDQAGVGCCQIYGALWDPEGNNVWNEWLDGSPSEFTLPMDGEYFFEVRSEDTWQAYTGSYAFAFRNIPPPEVFDLGDVLEQRTISADSPEVGMGRIEAPRGEDVYRFTANAGEMAQFMDFGYSSEGVFWDSPVWSLISPSGAVLFEDSIDAWGLGIRTFPETGEYQIRVRFYNTGYGTYQISVWPVTGVETFGINLGDVIEPDSPAGSGRIETAWGADVYEFEGTAGQALVLDENGMTEGCCLGSTLIAPAGTVLLNQNYLDYSDPERVILPETGTYRLVIHSTDYSGGSRGAYRLGVLLGEEAVFPLTLDVPVVLDSPGVGAGRIDSVEEQDVFTLSGVEGQLLYVDHLGNDGNLETYLQGPDGTRLYQTYFGNTDPGRIRLPSTGVYRLVVRPYPFSSDQFGSYSLVVRTVVDEPTMLLAIGETVTDGVPVAAAGRISALGQIDRYQVSVPAGTSFFIADLGSQSFGLEMWVYGPDGGLQSINTFDNRGEARRDVIEAGTWTIEVRPAGGYPDWMGTYSLGVFTVVDDGPIALTLPVEVSQDVPVIGAGNIETRGGRDAYTFAGTAGQVIYVNDRREGFSNQLLFQMQRPDGGFLISEWMDNVDPGRVVLPTTGTYTIRVLASSSWPELTGPYAFGLTFVEDQGPFALTIPAVVSDGVPAAGAGNLEVLGSKDTFTFTVEPGTLLYFQDGGSTLSRATMFVFEPNGSVLFSDRLDGNSAGRRILTAGGQYRVEVQSQTSPGAVNGPYSFSILPVVDGGPFALQMGDVIAPGSHGAGSGTIETPGSADVFTFELTKAQNMYVDDRIGTAGFPFLGMRWELRAPDGFVIVTDNLDGGDRSFFAAYVGTYTLTVFGGAAPTSIGNYSLRIFGGDPLITSTSADQVVPSGGTAEFSVTAESPFTPLNYRWLFNGETIAGADVQGGTSPTLRLSPLAVSREGQYRCVVSSPTGSTTSAPIALTVVVADFFVSAVTPGPVTSSLSQMDFTFSTGVDASTIGAADFQVTGPGGVLDPGTFTVTMLAADRYRLSFPAVTAAGTYQVTVGPNILGIAGQVMKPVAYTPYYATDFESGSEGVWDRIETATTTTTTQVLGRFGNETVTLTLGNLPPHESVRVTWDGLLIDTWDGNTAGGVGPDYFGVLVDGGATPAWEYTFNNGNRALQSYTLTEPALYGANFIYSGNPDALYRDLTFTVPHTASSVALGFRGRGLQSIGDESWAIDNVRVLLPSAADGTFRTSVTLDPVGPTVASFTPGGTSLVPVSSVQVDFNEPVLMASVAAADFALVRPDGSVVGANSVSRTSATRYTVNFPSQRMNGTYTLRVGPAIADLVGNLMNTDADGTPGEAIEDRFEGTFQILTPPQITSHPSGVTVLRNSTVQFSVSANATAPVTYQWQKNGSNLDGKTDPTLELVNVQLADEATYRCLVTDAGGTTPSSGAFLDVQQNYGILVPVADAERTTIPPVPGNGVAIELFNGIGGGTTPTPAALAGRSPSGTTLSPFIDFPRPGTSIGVGASFNTFFQNTTTPPEQVLGLAARNFILRHRFFISITPDLDMFPVTPEIDIQFGVGSDDGFYLTVGDQVLGSAGDRGFTYSWMPVSFAEPGLYPVELLFAANAIGASGLEFAWATAANTGGGIVPQNRMYVSPDLGDRLITFEEVPADSVLTTQYASEGVVFETLAGNPVTTSANPATFVPVSATRVLGDPAAASQIEIRFVSPGTTTPATTPFVAFFVIDAAAPGTVTKAYNAAGTEIYTRTSQAGAGSRELVTISAPGIARVRVTLGSGAETAAIDNLAFVSPVALPDLVMAGVAGPAAGAAGASITVDYTVTNLGSVPAVGPWTETVFLSTDGVAGSDQVLGTFSVPGPLAAGESVVQSRSVKLPAGVSGDHWFVVTTDAGEVVQESGSPANNTSVGAGRINISQPDLVTDAVEVVPTPYFGSTGTVRWTLRNAGSVDANGPVTTYVYLSLDDVLSGGDIYLGSAGALATPLAAGAKQPMEGTFALPGIGGVAPGLFRFLVVSDGANQLPEANEGNNVGSSAATQIDNLPRPDLVVDVLTVPGVSTFGAPLLVQWTVRNAGNAPAANWNDQITLRTEGGSVVANLGVRPAGAAAPLAPGASVNLSQTVNIPLNGLTAGSHRIAVTTDASFQLAESDETNNTRTSEALLLSPPPRPDLVVENIVVPPTVTPGVPFNVTWTTRNTGAVVAVAPWTETVSLSVDGEIGGDLLQVSVPVAAPLPAGVSVERSASVLIPHDGIAGTYRGVVTVDVGLQVVEESEVNNAAISAGSLVIPTQLRLVASTAQTTETGAAIGFTVTRNGARTAALPVTLTSSDAGELAVPVEVIIPAGAGSVGFNGTPVADGVVDDDASVTVQALAAAFTSASATVTVRNVDQPVLTLTVASPTVAEGLTVSATISRGTVTPVPVTVNLVSSNPGQLIAPSSVIIPAGQSSVTFALIGAADTLIEPDTAYRVDATSIGHVAAFVQVTVVDDDLPTLALTVNAASFPEGAGSAATQGTVTRSFPSDRALSVRLTSSDTTAATVPSTVIIPAGQASVNFNVAAVNDDVVDGNQPVTLQVVLLWGGVPTGDAVSRDLTVTDDDGATLLLSFNRGTLAEGVVGGAIGTLRRNTDTSVPLEVALAVDVTGELVLPPTVTIPVGSASVTFPVGTVDDGTPDGAKRVTVTAGRDGFTPGIAQMTVSDINLPDLVVASVSLPATGETDTFVTGSYRIENRGLRAATPFTIRLFLSSDTTFNESDVLASQYSFPGEVPAGSFFEVNPPIRLPRETGARYLIAVVDVNGVVTETDEANNTAISAPINIVPAYNATVSTDVDVVPAGTVIPMRGVARLNNGSPAPSVLVNVHVVVRGTRRVISALTDSAGEFRLNFTPLPGEAGHYDIAAAHPGVSAPPTQDVFVLLGFRIAAPGTISVIEGGSATGSLAVDNLSEIDLNAAAVEVVSKPAGLNVTANLSGTVLPGDGRLMLGYAVTAPVGVVRGGTARLRVTTQEGVSGLVDLPIQVDALRPRLVATPGSIVTGMRRGTQVTVAFEVANQGGLATGPMRLLLPPIPWLSSASTADLPSLAPGETTTISLLLTPPADLPLGPYSGSLLLGSDNSQVTVPFTFRCLSDSIGGMVVEVTDEYTFYAEGAPRVANAAIRLVDAFTGLSVLETNSGPTGLVTLPGLAENYYRLEISADQHSSYQQVHLVPAGGTTNVTAFLARQAVRYTWKVEPTEIEDRTKIVIETVFETAVPLPVVTIEPASVDLASIVGTEGQVNFKVTNHGLIAAKNASLQVPEHPDWIFEPLIREFGDLPAKTSLVVPMTIRRASAPGGGSALRRVAATAAGGGPCITAGFTVYELVCGEQTNKYTVPYVMYNAGAGCGGNGGSTFPRLDFRGEVGPGGGPGGGGPCFLCSVPTYHIPVTPASAPEGCDPCKLNLGIGLAECVIDQLANKFPLIKALNCMYALSKCGGKIADKGLGGALSLDCLNTIPGCSPIEIPGLSEFSCIRGLLCACVNGNSSGIAQCLCQLTDTPFTRDTLDKCGGGGGGGGSRRAAGVAVGPDHEQVYLRLNPLPIVPPNVPELAELRTRTDRLRRMMAPMVYVLDDEAWAAAKATDEMNIAFWAAFAERSSGASADQHLLNLAEFGQLVALTPPAGVPGESVLKFLNRWNRTVEYRRGGITNWTDLPDGFNEDFIADDVLQGLLAEAAAAREENIAEGFNDEYSAIKDARDRLNNALLNGGGVCARVKLRLEQEAVITRDAFKATLEVENNTAGALDLVDVDLRVEREDGSESTIDFGVRTPTLTGLSAVDGSGVIGASSTGKATWILVPTSDAAPTVPTVHYVSGTLRYRQDGVLITVPLAPSRIEVLPNPNLVVQYFHQRDVFSDDPFTDPIEPSIPFTLGVLVRNEGYGTARNFRIISGQPEIIENERGLLVDFKIIATEVAGQNLTPSLTANFGNVGPGQIVIGRWLFTSTLQGNFREYTASFAHQDELGDPRLSLIEAVTIHEMTRMVEVGAPFNDGKPDFLVNDKGDPRNMPDTLYLSDGSTNDVALVELASVSGVPGGGVTEVTVNAAMPAGWTYLRIPEPSNGSLRLRRIVRSDGKELGLDREFWVTDRTFPGLGARPIYEQMLHLIDHNSTGSYRLIYVDPPAPDGVAPVSAVLPLPANSPAQIPVSWSGSDNTGVTSYDIYVSEDGGPFAAWLTATPLTGSIYPGTVGRTYAFFSRARDQAGNVEAQPASPDAQTAVAFVSSAPTISGIAPQTTPAGLPITGLSFNVGDSDTPLNELTINVGSSNPGLISSASVAISGDGAARTLTLTPASGQAGLATITLTVSDGSASASTSFLVTVTARNNSPIAGADTVSRKPGEALKVAISELLANDTDPDFDPVRFASVTSPTANGGSVRRSGPWILYTPPTGSDAPDSFTYQVSDGRGGLGIGVVQVNVIGGNTTPSRNVLTLDRDLTGRVTIRFAGIPGRLYRIEATPDLGTPTWTSLGTATAGVNGLFEFTDNDAASHATRYYRSVDVTAP